MNGRSRKWGPIWLDRWGGYRTDRLLINRIPDARGFAFSWGPYTLKVLFGPAAE